MGQLSGRFLVGGGGTGNKKFKAMAGIRLPLKNKDILFFLKLGVMNYGL